VDEPNGAKISVAAFRSWLPGKVSAIVSLQLPFLIPRFLTASLTNPRSSRSDWTCRILSFVLAETPTLSHGSDSVAVIYETWIVPSNHTSRSSIPQYGVHGNAYLALGAVTCLSASLKPCLIESVRA